MPIRPWMFALWFGLVGCGARNATSAERQAVEEPAPGSEVLLGVRRMSPWPEGSLLFGRAERVAMPSANRPARGAQTGLIELVIFSDFECPFCARANATLDDLRARFPQIRFIFRNNPLPFHNNAMPAAIAALEAYAQGRDSGFWKMHDRLFENQRALEGADLERVATEIGLDMPRFRSAMQDGRHADTIAKDQELAQHLGATGTPVFYINGRQLRGAQPLEEFVAVVQNELELAAEAIDHGVPAEEIVARIYAHSPTGPSEREPVRVHDRTPPEIQRFTIAIPNDAPTRGARDARVVIQEFTDMECPFCSRVNPTLEQLLRDYEGRIRLVFRHYPLPFHQNARDAHRAALEVRAQRGDEKFWAFTNLVFENRTALEHVDLERYAAQVGGVRMERFRRALYSDTHDLRVQADIDAVQSAGMQIGTPSFLINDRLMQGAQSVEAFRAAIDEELARVP